MKEQDVKLTLHETEQLCRLYMDCKLSVLEETELQYVLGKLPYSSPCIDEVRRLMGLTIAKETKKSSKIKFRFWESKSVISIAASFTILLIAGITLFRNQSINAHPDDDTDVYISAYSYGELLKGSEAIAATNIAIAKADSLMKYASVTESNYMMKANDIIYVTSDN